MAVLDSLLPDRWAVSLVVRVALAVGLISIIGIALARCFRHQAAARHFVLLAALACALVSPLVAFAFLTQRVAPLVLTLPAPSSPAAPAREPQIVPRPRTAAFVPAKRSPELHKGAATAPTETEWNRPISSTAPVQEASLFVPSPETTRAGEASFNPAHASLRLALIVWAAGSLLLSLRVLRGWLWLRAAARSFRYHNSGMLADLLQQARQVVQGRRLPRVAESDHVCTPIAAGLFRPVIVLPSGLSTTLGPAELRDVLVHEFAHIVRRDQIVIVLQAVAHVAYWPIWPVHWLNRLLANAREEVCDNYVLARQQPVTYGETLLRVAALSRNLATFDTSTAILGWRGRLEDRVLELISERRNRSKHVKPLLAASLLAVLALATAGLCGTTLTRTQGVTLTRVRGDALVEASSSRPARTVVTKSVDVDDSVNLRAPNSLAEKAVANLVLVFFQDRARRAVNGIVLDAGDHSLIFTPTTAGLVPDDLPPAVDSMFLERAGKPPVDAPFDPHSNSEIHVYRAKGHLSSYQFPEAPTVAVGDALDSIESRPTALRHIGQIEVRKHTATVRAVNQEASITIRHSHVRTFSSLIEVDCGFPEGTALFKDGKLVGMTIVGTRFLENNRNRSYLLPVERMAALYRSITNEERQKVTPEFPFTVPFEVGEKKFLNGDEITILEVRGTADTFATENIYWIKGTYTLASHEKAQMLASITTTGPSPSSGRGFKAQNLIVDQGTGTFTLFLPMSCTGFPHVSFYPAEGGNDLGGVYFGTGNSVHRQGGDHDGESPAAKRIWDALGLRFAELSRHDPRLSAMRFPGGLQIIDIRPESPADRSGLRKDDIVVGLERYATPKLSDVIWILEQPRVDEPPPSKLSFKFLRGGKQDSSDVKLAPSKVSSIGDPSDARHAGRRTSLFTIFARLP
jgi:beta-lactamase regulating signal transducer with metallopeptidase domain